ncbi:hypothetical protein Zmor_006678 [Zophobas morio]|uniref:Uncharacterized protein n=1 Tax=Zophobas morio TaxID=2755281 RepID=A0AA38IQM3_9CUCU|nr:hypothetical protein Zmor_006678 [Zophobas morio]
MRTLHLLCVFTIFRSAVADEECNKPTELKLKEEYCWTEEIEVVDRIVQRSKNVLNFAKKKLGIATEDENDEKKCEYYICILRQLHMLNANDYPAYDSIQEWIKKNVVYFQAVDLMDQLYRCHDALTNSTVREINFYADQIEPEQKSSNDGNNNSEIKTSTKDQSTCEIAAEFIDCLSRQKRCPVFQYP